MADSTTIGGTTINSELQGVLRDTGVGLWSFDGASGVFAFDATCRELFDLSPDEALGPATLRAHIHPDDLAGYWASIREAMAGNGEFSVQYRILRRDGSVRFISGRGRVRPHLPGEHVMINGVCIDVSERHRLEEKLHATELRLQALADSFPGLFCHVDRNYIVRFLSQRYLQHMGKPREAVVGQHLADLTGPEHFECRRPLYERALAGVPYSFEESRPLPNGEQRYYALTYQPDRDASGEVRGFVVIGLDITELRMVEQRLREKTRELSRSNHDLEQFAYVASHDLKAPLRAVEVIVEWLQEDLAGHDIGDVRENLALLAQRTSRLHRLLDDLLAYSRAGRGQGEATRVDLRQMACDIAVLLDPPAGMCIEADEGLPELLTSRAPLEQVLRNLINNAVKHHPTRQGRVRVYAEQHDGQLVLAVEDDGAGIPLEFSDKVFQMFQTLKPRDEVEGSGMGLAIVKRIVEGHDGRVWFKPGPNGRGTVFKFTWPQAGAARPAEHRHESRKRRHSAR